MSISHLDALLETNKNKIIGSRKISTMKQSFKKILSEFSVSKVEITAIFDPGVFTFGGEYDPIDDVILLEVYIPRSDCGIFSLEESQWENFKFLLNQNLQHEFIHRKQKMSRKIDFWNKFHKIENKGPIHKLEDRVYLSDFDEIEAFAHDLSMEIQYYYPDDKIDEVLRNPSRFRKVNTYRVYKKTFKNTNWTDIRKQLLKKTFKNIKLEEK
jgi:hypothetical protein